MPTPSQRQVFAPSSGTLAVRKVFCFGVALGMLAASCILFVILQYIRSHLPGEGLNRSDAIVRDDGETRYVNASSCDVFRAISKTREASGPVRFHVELSRIVDGDTIRVIWHGESLSVRLLGIDAPERKQTGGPEATECLRALLAGADTVDLEFEDGIPRRDSLGRLLAYVWRDDLLVNVEMVRRGHPGLFKNGGKGRYGEALRHAKREQAK